ncbi:MAG: hypothetical protein JSR30_00285 [Proteobacteria bacterium]|nr:hypothetical protein [Pseudomonadota bacterium]
MNLAPTIIPKSDQLNSDDLITGPITIKITAVNSGTKEQPVSIRYEGDEGRPYKPSKSMRRVLVMLWTDDGTKYIGKKLRLYRDPRVKFGGAEVGGIRISHASDIGEAQTFSLTETRGRRVPFTVEPLTEEILTEKPCPLTGLPQAWLDWTQEERGEFVAGRGIDDLKKWWQWLPKADRDALAGKLDGWKAKAAEKDGAK